MPLLQVKDCPESLYDRLRERAKKEHRSIAQQTLYIIESYLDGRIVEPSPAPIVQQPTPERPVSIYRRQLTPEEIEQRKERRRKVFESIDARGPIPVPEGYSSMAELVRECREERDAQNWANHVRCNLEIYGEKRGDSGTLDYSS